MMTVRMSLELVPESVGHMTSKNLAMGKRGCTRHWFPIGPATRCDEMGQLAVIIGF